MNQELSCPHCAAELPRVHALPRCPKCQGMLPTTPELAMSNLPTANPPEAGDEPMGPPVSEDFCKRYEIKGELGAGAMGTVYLAKQIALERLVAIKCVRGLTGSMRLRLVAEGKSLARLNHTNLVLIYDAGEAGGLPYLVFEYVKGQSLRQMLMKDGALHLERAFTLGDHLLDGLGYAHEEGVIHRDIKPENLLVSDRGRLKIADFGLAQVIEGQAPAAGMTAAGQIIGTPEYLSPERIAGEPSTPSADIYAAGLVLYEMFAGRRPFESRGLKALIDHSERIPPSPRMFRPDIPEPVAAAILWSLEKDPTRRPRRITDLRIRMAKARPDDLDASPSASGSRASQGAGGEGGTASSNDPFVTAMTKAMGQSTWGGRDKPGAGVGAAATMISQTSAISSAIDVPGLKVLPRNRRGYFEYEDTLDGSIYVHVPEGSFEMGADGQTLEETPIHTVALSSYLIGKHPVTNRQYLAFVKATGHAPPANSVHPGRTLWVDGAPPSEILDQPVINVSHADAFAYAAWAGKRLPTEAEWENAARGTGKGPYPWGASEPGQARSLFGRIWQGKGTLLPIGRLPEGESPFGVAEMSGSVWEWTGDWFAPDAYRMKNGKDPSGPAAGELRAVRGGSWSEVAWYLRVTARLGFYPEGRYDIVGFRLVRGLV